MNNTLEKQKNGLQLHDLEINKFAIKSVITEFYIFRRL